MGMVGRLFGKGSRVEEERLLLLLLLVSAIVVLRREGGLWRCSGVFPNSSDTVNVLEERKILCESPHQLSSVVVCMY